MMELSQLTTADLLARLDRWDRDRVWVLWDHIQGYDGVEQVSEIGALLARDSGLLSGIKRQIRLAREEVQARRSKRES
jgi:hypothetical protein